MIYLKTYIWLNSNTNKIKITLFTRKNIYKKDIYITYIEKTYIYI